MHCPPFWRRYSGDPGPGNLRRGSSDQAELLRATAVTIADLDDLGTESLNCLREQVGTLGLRHGLDRRWAIIDAGAGSVRPRSRRVAYRLDADRIAVLRPEHFHGFPENEAAALLETELTNLASIVSAEQSRALRCRALLDAIATPLPVV